MLLSEWGSEAPSSGCMNQAVLDVLAPVLSDMGAGPDPDCWVAWGDDPEYKYSVLAPTAAGLVAVAVRLNPGGEGGPRATAKLVRWPKLQIGEFAIEAGEGHRVVAVQVEGLVLKGTDDLAGRICEFVRGLMAGADGRAVAPVGTVVIQAAPAAAVAAPATKLAARLARAEAQDGSEAAPAPKSAARKAAKAPKPEEEEEAWVAPHPIPIADEPVADESVAPAPASEPAPAPAAEPAPGPAPLQPAPVQPAPAFGPGTRESGSVWEVPAVDPSALDPKKPRTWRP